MEQNDQIEPLLATVHTLLRADGADDAADVVQRYPAKAEQTGYDNWNGGTNYWQVQFKMPASDYARLGARRSQLEEQITVMLRSVTEHEENDCYSALLIPDREFRADWRSASRSDLHKKTRQNILDGLRLDDVDWSGHLNDVEFLSRLYDLEEMPSTDSRYKDAVGDIWQHRCNNHDWENDWVYSDSRFCLADGGAEDFLRFLCEMVHPLVRPNRDEALTLVEQFNDQLRGAGWELYQEELIAGRPRFAFRSLEHSGGRSVRRAKAVADALNAGWMAKQIERVELAVDADPELAIGTAKELLETCCKSILSKRGIAFTKSDDMGDLTKKLTKALQLVPEGVSDAAKGAENVRLILRNLTQITSNLTQLRGLYGTGHGKDGQYRGLQPRHARLAVAAAVAFIDFVSETHRYRDGSEGSGKA
ncbi:abortive infection family protein [Pseudomonas gingeri]|uniref:abortive infection family protein n=1 Tax=Pseudomonas gingeri TaxID=117681 RepID=UPI0015A4C3A3|nr:abortive infection family protein [Pseudomonas gingeri]NVZ75182.1 abortive infection family protein [Pseudomonas gingeri]